MINCLRKLKKMKNVSAIPILNDKGNCVAIYNGRVK